MILATAGHIDHGKTTLVRALTGVDADRLPEEKRRGLTIDLGFAYTTLPDGTELGFVDVPGHERFLPNMLAGVLSIDRVLLIVAADDGPKPQTLEHLDILELIGVAEVTGVVTKIDRVDDERRDEVVAEVAILLADAGYHDAPIHAVSSHTGEGVAALAAHLSERAAVADLARVAKPAEGGFRLPIDRVFSLPGIGTVATGTVASGSVAPGDRLLLSPRGIEVRVRGAHAHNRPVERAAAVDRCALNIVGSFPDGAEPGRGDWLVAPELHAPTSRIDVALRMSRAAPGPLRSGLPVHVHLGTEDRVGRLAVLGQHSLAPGADGFAQLDLDRPIGALWGDRVVLRDHGALRTLAGGRVVDPDPPRRGRARPERLATLAALHEYDAGTALEGLLRINGAVALAPFALARNLTLDQLGELVAAGGFVRCGETRAPYAASEAHLAALAEQLAATLAEFHRAEPDTLGVARPALLRRLRAAAPEPVLDAALSAAIDGGQIVRDGAVLRLPAHQPRLSRDDERLWQRVAPLLAADDLRPPRVRELAEALGLEPEAAMRLLKRYERFGRIAPVAGNRYFLPEAVVRLALIARELAECDPNGAFTAASFKDRSGVGRNLTIEILEYLDRIGVTRRVGDARVMQASSEELFAR
ncbi:MAG TPA: selenocysteine-specific translation elongation factor [Stellaceae bacterium]|jgi:selenocysteine-specific elongation factor|nr:selenocysteine-specific translation elongation factor [Stellaceae bacterium]